MSLTITRISIFPDLPSTITSRNDLIVSLNSPSCSRAAFHQLNTELFIADEDREVVMEDTYLCLKRTTEPDTYFNVAVFKCRMEITFEMFLTEANLRGKAYEVSSFDSVYI